MLFPARHLYRLLGIWLAGAAGSGPPGRFRTALLITIPICDIWMPARTSFY